MTNKLATIFILSQWWPNQNFWTTGLVTLNSTICELRLRMCSISVDGVYCMITIPAIFAFQALWWSLLPLRHSLPPRVVSGFTCSKASRPLLNKTDSLLKYGSIWSTDSQSSLANIFLPLLSRWFLVLLHTAAPLALFLVSSPSRKILLRCVFTFSVKRNAHVDVFRAHRWGFLKTGWSTET